jgi:dihydroxyacetone kinase
MEIGLGIHGEQGVKRMRLQPANELTETLLTEILKYGKVGDEKRVAVMVNNLGAVTEMELAIVARHAMRLLESREFTVERIYAGTFLSSLDMAGISISVLGVNDQWLRWLDAATTAPAWPNASRQPPGKPESRIVENVPANVTSPITKGPQSKSGRKVKQAIEAACKALIDAERELTEMDRVTGDGDLGTNMERAAKAIQSAVNSYPLDDLPATLKALGHTLRRQLGGSSGPLYGVLFLRCGTALEGSGTSGIAQWAEALDQGCRAISELGGAKLGDRTMLDALDPFVKAMKKNQDARTPRETVISALDAAERGMEATAQMKPRLGRSSYLGDRVLGYPDPGAKVITIWLRCACEALFPHS